MATPDAMGEGIGNMDIGRRKPLGVVVSASCDTCGNVSCERIGLLRTSSEKRASCRTGRRNGTHHGMSGTAMARRNFPLCLTMSWSVHGIAARQSGHAYGNGTALSKKKMEFATCQSLASMLN